jgi:hypothetical protein
VGNRIHIPIRLVFVFVLITTQVLFINNSAFAAVNTRLVFVSNQFNFPTIGAGTLVLDVEAVSNAGSAQISVFSNAFQLDAPFLAQNPQVSFSDEYFTFDFGPPAHIYLSTQSFSDVTGEVFIEYSFFESYPFPGNTRKSIGTNYQRIVRITIEYAMGSTVGSIAWLPGFNVTNQNGDNITGVQEDLPPEFTDIPLPVELSSFNAVAEGGKVVLTWVTQSEINNQGFEVYRSIQQDGEYALIATYENNPSLQGAGNSNTRRTYIYEDVLISSGETYWYQIADVDYDGIRTFHGPVSVESQDLIPEEYILHPNYPNPFNPETNIRFEIPSNSVDSRVKLAVYNNLGMEVRTLVSGTVEPGVHTEQWDGSNTYGEQMASGVYFLRLQAGTFTQTQKMLLVR